MTNYLTSNPIFELIKHDNNSANKYLGGIKYYESKYKSLIKDLKEIENYSTRTRTRSRHSFNKLNKLRSLYLKVDHLKTNIKHTIITLISELELKNLEYTKQLVSILGIYKIFFTKLVVESEKLKNQINICEERRKEYWEDEEKEFERRKLENERMRLEVTTKHMSAEDVDWNIDTDINNDFLRGTVAKIHKHKATEEAEEADGIKHVKIGKKETIVFDTEDTLENISEEAAEITVEETKEETKNAETKAEETKNAETKAEEAETKNAETKEEAEVEEI